MSYKVLTMPTNKKQPKNVDVAKPGNVAADATARPIIVGHGSALNQDPMMATQPGAAKNDEKKEPMSHKTAAISQVKNNAQEASAEDSGAVSSEETSLDNQPESSDKATVEAVADEVSTKKQHEQEDQETQARTQALQELIESKKYFVPIGEAQKRRSMLRLWWAIFLLLVLGVVGANFAIDGELLDIGIKPLTDLL